MGGRSWLVDQNHIIHAWANFRRYRSSSLYGGEHVRDMSPDMPGSFRCRKSSNSPSHGIHGTEQLPTILP